MQLLHGEPNRNIANLATNFRQYGGQIGEPASDWSTYGFGTPAYNKILNTAAQATKDNDLVIDLALGPESGQGVPAEWDNR